MSRLAEIIETGIAPGFNTKAIDPQLPEKAVPKAFKDLEHQHSADKIARDARFSVKQIKRIWNMLALLTGLLAVTAGAADLTRSITFTDGSILRASQLHTLIDGAQISTAFLTGKDLLSAVDNSDYLLIYDVSAGLFKRMTVSTLVMGNTGIVTTQTEKPNLVPLDYLLVYDSVGGVLAKIAYTNLLSGNTNLIGQQPILTALDPATDAAMLVRHGGTNSQIAVTNLWKSFLYRAAFTNLAEHTAPTNTDQLLIWDSFAGTNKWTGLTGLTTNTPTSAHPPMSSKISLVVTGELKNINLTELNATLSTNLTTLVTTNFPMSSYTAVSQAHLTNHGFGVTPKIVKAVLVCLTAELGYSIGDEVDAQTMVYTATGNQFKICTTYANATQVGCILYWNGSFGTAEIANRTTGVNTAITKANWALRLYARP